MKNRNNIKWVDMLFSIMVYLLILVFLVYLAHVFSYHHEIELVGIVVTSNTLSAVMYIIVLALIVGYLTIRKISWNHFPLDFSDKKKVKDGIVLGIGLGFAISMYFILRFVFFDSSQEITSYHWLEYITYAIYILLIVSLMEELLFRVFFQTIFNRIIKIEALSVCIVGVLFAFAHLMSLALLTPSANFGELLRVRMFDLMSLFSLHCLFYLLIRKYNNVLPAVIVHFFWNVTLFFLQ